jgi:membrane associated rhomboid family serine protease
VLLVTNVAAYALQLLSRGALTSWGAKVRLCAAALTCFAARASDARTCGAQVNSRIAAGQLWRLVTPALLHGGVLHLLLNSYALNELGPSAEALLGRGRFVALYALSAVSGNVASYVCSPRSAVGASGAVFGLLGCLGVYLARHRHLHGELELKCATSMARIASLLTRWLAQGRAALVGAEPAVRRGFAQRR